MKPLFPVNSVGVFGGIVGRHKGLTAGFHTGCHRGLRGGGSFGSVEIIRHGVAYRIRSDHNFRGVAYISAFPVMTIGYAAVNPCHNITSLKCCSILVYSFDVLLCYGFMAYVDSFSKKTFAFFKKTEGSYVF
jgi:hypothetical protein